MNQCERTLPPFSFAAMQPDLDWAEDALLTSVGAVVQKASFPLPPKPLGPWLDPLCLTTCPQLSPKPRLQPRYLLWGHSKPAAMWHRVGVGTISWHRGHRMSPRALPQSRRRKRSAKAIRRKQTPPQKRGVGLGEWAQPRGVQTSLEARAEKFEVPYAEETLHTGMESETDLTAFLLVLEWLLQNTGIEGTLNMQGCKAVQHHTDSSA